MGLLTALAAIPPASAQPSASRTVVTAAVQVTANPAPVRAHSSPKIAVNPKNGHLVIVESDPRGRRSCDIHVD